MSNSKKKFKGLIVAGEPVTTAHGIQAGVFKSSEGEPKVKSTMPGNITPEQIEALKKARNNPGS